MKKFAFAFILAGLITLPLQAQKNLYVKTLGGEQASFDLSTVDSIKFNRIEQEGETLNLLTNGGFESWTDGQPNEWKSTTTASSGKLTQSGDAHDGAYAVSLEGNATSNKRLGSKELTLNAGTYVFSFYAKGTTNAQAQIRPGRTTVGSSLSYSYGDYVTISNSEWTHVNHLFTLDETTTVNLIVMNPKKTATLPEQSVLIDDATLTLFNGAFMYVHVQDRKFSYNIDDVASIWVTTTGEGEVGSKENPYTVAELKAAMADVATNAYYANGATVYTRGIVTKVREWNADYNNISYYISDTSVGTNQFYVYRGNLIGNAKVTTGRELHAGDTVTVCGKIKNFKGTIEYDTGNTIVAISPFNRVRSAERLQWAKARLEFPKTKENGSSRIILHEAQLNDVTNESGLNYALEWDSDIRAQRWSCYQMYGSLLDANTSRSASSYPNDLWLEDDEQFENDPYSGSGYDHGHICPSADRLASDESNLQTFYMTNMQPQTHTFNAGIWKRMEEQVRKWAENYDTLYIAKGATIDNKEYIQKYIVNEKDSIPVPKYFYMAMLGRKGDNFTSIAFWVEHRDDITKKTPLSDFVVNIRELEEKTNIDFFHNLPDDIETAVETVEAAKLSEDWGL